jgi:hypothetical protein
VPVDGREPLVLKRLTSALLVHVKTWVLALILSTGTIALASLASLENCVNSR